MECEWNHLYYSCLILAWNQGYNPASFLQQQQMTRQLLETDLNRNNPWSNRFTAPRTQLSNWYLPVPPPAPPVSLGYFYPRPSKPFIM